MTSFCIAASSVSHSLIETGILWSFSLTKNPESIVRASRSGPLPRHKDEPLEEMNILLVLQQSPMEGRDNGLAVLGPQGVGRDVLREQELQPVEQLGGRGLFLEAGHLAHLEEHFERLAKERLLEPRKVHLDDPLHRFLVGEADVVEKTAPQKSVGQLLFVVRGDEDDGALRCLHELPSFVHEELHAVELAQEVVGKLDVRLVDLVDEEHDRRLGSERLPQHSADDVVADLVHPGVAELGIAQAAHGVVFVQALLRLGRGLDVPFEERQPERLCNLHREHGLAGARLAFYQQGAFERDRRVDREREVVGGDVSFGAFESHRSILASGCASLYTIARCVHCFPCCCVLPLPPTRPRSPSTWAISSRSRARPVRTGVRSLTSTGSLRRISRPPCAAGDSEPCSSAPTASCRSLRAAPLPRRRRIFSSRCTTTRCSRISWKPGNSTVWSGRSATGIRVFPCSFRERTARSRAVSPVPPRSARRCAAPVSRLRSITPTRSRGRTSRLPTAGTACTTTITSSCSRPRELPLCSSKPA